MSQATRRGIDRGSVHGVRRGESGRQAGGIERGERNPSLVNICRIAGALAVEVTELLEGVLAIAPDA